MRAIVWLWLAAQVVALLAIALGLLFAPGDAPRSPETACSCDPDRAGWCPVHDVPRRRRAL